MEFVLTTQFRRDLKRYKHNAILLAELKKVLDFLEKSGVVPPSYSPHSLHGDYADCMECHIKDDSLLIWMDKTKPFVKLLRFGSHSELFGKGRKR